MDTYGKEIDSFYWGAAFPKIISPFIVFYAYNSQEFQIKAFIDTYYLQVWSQTIVYYGFRVKIVVFAFVNFFGFLTFCIHFLYII